MAKVKRPVIQTHHISYQPEVTVKLFQGEHWCITQLERRKKKSKGLFKWFRYFAAMNEDNAIDLEINHE
jgi:hypothetical protein